MFHEAKALAVTLKSVTDRMTNRIVLIVAENKVEKKEEIVWKTNYLSRTGECGADQDQRGLVVLLSRVS